MGYHDFDFDFGECLRTRTLMMVWLAVAKVLYYWELMWTESNVRCTSSRRWSLHS